MVRDVSSAHDAEVSYGPEPDHELYLGDAIGLFLNAKRAGGRSPRTIDEYRKKLDLFQRWAAPRAAGESEVDLPLGLVGPDEVEAYAVHMKERGLSDSSRKNHLAVLRSFFDTLRRRVGVDDPTAPLDDVRFHQKAPRRNYLTETSLAPVSRLTSCTDSQNLSCWWKLSLWSSPKGSGSAIVATCKGLPST